LNEYKSSLISPYIQNRILKYLHTAIRPNKEHKRLDKNKMSLGKEEEEDQQATQQNSEK
jgi:hypothetical protein